MDQFTAGRAARDRFFKSGVVPQGVCIRSLLIYLALTIKKEDIADAKLQYLLPRRANNRGRPPTILSVGVDEKRERGYFPKPPGLLTPEEVRWGYSCMVEQILRATFSTHYYIWNGVLYKQVSGAPMGLNGSGPASRVLMDLWVDRVRDVEEKSNIMASLNPMQYEKLTINLFRKYVDAVFTALQQLRKGARWDPQLRLFTWTVETEQEDSLTDAELHTMDTFCAIATSLIPCLRFNWDCPAKHPDYRMPVLDTTAWIGLN